MSDPFQTRLARELAKREANGLYRRRRLVDAVNGTRVRVDGREAICFCSNDYLGLATHPRLVEAQQRAAQSFGAGAGAAHLVSGHQRVHHQLEERLAAFTGRERVLVFSTGYMANLGIANALLRRGDHIYEDRLNHASLLDAGVLARAKVSRYAHADIVDLCQRMSLATAPPSMVLTDGVFSMDGDIAPLGELAAACRANGSWLVVDDAHGIGVLGDHGRGSLEHCGVEDQVPVLMGTLGKAFGSFGAFVAGSALLIETLINNARTYIYTTALPPGVAAASTAAIDIMESEPERRSRLNALVKRFRDGISGEELLPSQTPIQSILIGDSARAIQLSEALLAHGLLVGAIRPPTVPRGTARLRVTLSAAHSEADVDRLLETLVEVGV